MNDASKAPSAGRCPMLYNPLLPEFRDNPHPFLHELRRVDPVHYSSVYQMWIITRYADCIAALKDERLSASSLRWENYNRFFERPSTSALPEGGIRPADVYRNWMLQNDAPDHTRLRGLVNKAFTPRVCESFRPRIQAIVDELLNAIESRGDQMELIADLACPLPVRVIAELMGTPPEDFQKISDWSNQMLPSFGPTMSAAEYKQVSLAVGSFKNYFDTLVAERKKSPRVTLLDSLIAATNDGDKLTDDELVATCILLVFAGHATTVQLIASGTWNLLRHPVEHKRLMDDPKLINSAIEEMLRFEAPLQYISRVVTEDFVLAGQHLRKGQLVLISTTAANRDPAQFPDPDKFDITRKENRHLAFGFYSHYCAGAPLARLEAGMAINSMLKRFPQLNASHSTLQRERSLLLRGVESLPLHLKARRCPMERIAC